MLALWWKSSAIARKAAPSFIDTLFQGGIPTSPCDWLWLLASCPGGDERPLTWGAWLTRSNTHPHLMF